MFPFFRKNSDPYADLLRSSRRSTYKKKRRRRIFLVFLIVCLGVGYWGYTKGWVGTSWLHNTKKSERDPNLEAVIEAKERVKRSTNAAILPSMIRVRGDDDGPKLNDAETATFKEGTATLLRGTLAKNENLISVLVERGVDVNQTHMPVAATGKKFNFRYSRPGDKWECQVAADGTILSLKYQTSPEDVYLTTKDHDGNYLCEKLIIPVEIAITTVTGTVDESLWKSLEEAGAPAPLAVSFLDIFAYAVDFHSIMQNGDKFAIIYERVLLEGEYLRTGKMLAARYISSEQVYDAFFDSTVPNDKGEYYDSQGEGMQGSFLKSPLSSVKITSKFGKRFHPVLGRMKAHNGVDYGAPIGTPVQAVADGVVTWAARKGPNGNLITIKHDNGYVTHYAHLSKILVKKGATVKKKDVIGKVGTTGRSTGPHLHFGMAVNGRFVNPLKVKFPRIASLTGEHLKEFLREVVDPMNEQLDTLLPIPKISNDSNSLTSSQKKE